jgi:hypothetical protein
MRTLREVLIANQGAIVIKPATLGITVEDYLKRPGANNQGYVVVIETQEGHVDIFTANTMKSMNFIPNWDGNSPIISFMDEDVAAMLDHADISFNVQDDRHNKLYDMLEFFDKLTADDIVSEVYSVDPRLK